jgi:agmatine deiminase
MKQLEEQGANFKLLPRTKDIWAVDYMPIQIDADRFIQFEYRPSYLENSKLISTISDTSKICKAIGLNVIKSNIRLDGGNVTKFNDRVIITDRIFKENPNYEQALLLNMIKELLEVDNLYVIPAQPYDFTGHSDGMVRFLDNRTLLINDYSNESKSFRERFDKAIKATGLETITVPYNPYQNNKTENANGDYINFLQMEGVVYLPVFNLKEDEAVVRLFDSLFIGQKIVPINANEIANDGGVLNCISWNIRI